MAIDIDGNDQLKLLNEIFLNPSVAEHLQAAPEPWLWSLLNSMLAAVPAVQLYKIPQAILFCVTFLFSVLNPGYIENYYRTSEFYSTPSHELKTNYDFIIVGAGTAGCLLANRLSADYSVLLIEAGSATNLLSHVPLLNLANLKDPNSGLDWLYHSVEQKHAFRKIHKKRAHMGAGRGMGGSSHLNLQIYSRAWDEDYDRWERVYGAEGWNSKEMVHFMKKHERVFEEPLLSSDRHGKDGELSVIISPLGEKRKSFINAWFDASSKITSSKVIEDHNSGKDEGFSKIQTTVDPSGRLSHSAAAFIDPIRIQRKHNLHIILEHMVDKVLLDDSGTARGVQVRNCDLKQCSGSSREFSATKEIILSAGTARNPQILMLSGIGPRETLEQHQIPVRVDLPGVGENLHDHVLSYGQGIVFPEWQSNGGKGWTDWELGELYKFFTNRTGFFLSPAGAVGVGFIHSPISEDEKRPDIEVVAVDMSPATTVSAGSWMKFGLSKEDFVAYFIGKDPQMNQNGIVLSSILERSKSRGKVRLASTNIVDPPILDMQYLSDPHDIKVLVEAQRYLRKSAQALSGIGARPIENRIPGCEGDLDSDEYLECNVRSFTMSIWHMAGTCRLGQADDPLAVVDNHLRVRGVKQLRVVDASVIPEETTGHMVATVYGIAEKAAHLILHSVNSSLNKDEL